MGSSSGAIMRYRKKNYARLELLYPAEMKEELTAAAKAAGVSLSRYVLEAVELRSGLKLTLDKELATLQPADDGRAEQNRTE